MAEEKTTESLHKDVNDSTEEGVQSVGTLLTQIIEEIVDPDEIDLLDEVSLKTTEYDNSTAFIIATDSIEVPRWLENHQNKKKSEELNESTDDDYDVLQEVDEEDALEMVFKSADDTTDEIGVTSSNATSLLVCRICHGSESVENYVSPCKCKGTLSKVHKTCLEHWLAESDTSYCELCGHEYITERVPQYSLLASVYRWATCSDSWRDIRDLLVDLVVMCIFTPMIVMGTYAGIVTTENLYRLDLMASSIQIPMTPTRLISLTLVFFTATMDLVYTSWMIVRFQHHFAQWHRWWRRKCMVRLVIEKNDKQLAEINQEQESGYTFD